MFARFHSISSLTDAAMSVRLRGTAPPRAPPCPCASEYQRGGVPAEYGMSDFGDLGCSSIVRGGLLPVRAELARARGGLLARPIGGLLLPARTERGVERRPLGEIRGDASFTNHSRAGVGAGVVGAGVVGADVGVLAACREEDGEVAGLGGPKPGIGGSGQRSGHRGAWAMWFGRTMEGEGRAISCAIDLTPIDGDCEGLVANGEDLVAGGDELGGRIGRGEVVSSAALGRSDEGDSVVKRTLRPLS